jgi:hypothetical protein
VVLAVAIAVWLGWGQREGIKNNLADKIEIEGGNGMGGGYLKIYLDKLGLWP